MKIINVSRKGLICFLLLVLYKFTLDISYVFGVSKIYKYMGFDVEFNLLKYIILSLITLILLVPVLINLQSNKPSCLAVFLISVLYFLPGMTYLAFVNIDTLYILFYCFYWLLMVFWSSFFSKLRLSIKHADLLSSRLFLAIFLAMCFLIVFYVSGKYTGFRFHFSFSDVYELRAEEREMNMSKYLQYLVPIISSVLPCLVVYYMVVKRYVYVLGLILLELFLFGLGGSKSIIFMLFISILIPFFYKNTRLIYLPALLGSFNIIGLLEYFLFQKSLIFSYINHRTLLLPNQISYFIFDFIEKNEFLYLRESVLRFFGFDSPYARSIFFIIGEEYYNDTFTRANTGLVGDAYSQFGFSSLIVYPLLIPFVFTIFDLVSRQLDYRVKFIVIFLFSYTFINGSFFTVLLTSGFLIIILLYYFINSSIYYNR